LGPPGDGAVSHSLDEATGVLVLRESRSVQTRPLIAGPTMQTEMRIINSNKSFFMGCGGWDKKIVTGMLIPFFHAEVRENFKLVFNETIRIKISDFCTSQSDA
jgi:hypothetical protein